MEITIRTTPLWIRGRKHSMYRASSLDQLVGQRVEAALQCDGKAYLVRASAIKTALGDTTVAAAAWQLHCERSGIKPSDIVSLPMSCTKEVKA